MFCGSCCRREEVVKVVVADKGLEPSPLGTSLDPSELNDPFAPTADPPGTGAGEAPEAKEGREAKEEQAGEEEGEQETQGTELTIRSSRRASNTSEDSLGRVWHSFSIVLERPQPGESLGVTFDACMPAHIYVNRVVQNVNGEPLPAGVRALRKGDFIMSVNGTAGEHMARELLCVPPGGKLELNVRRPMEFEILLEKDGSLGCGIIYDANVGSTLGISGIQDGPVKRWNEQAKAAGRNLEVLREGDRIVCVNGKRSTSYELLEAIRNSSHLKLRVARPCNEDQ